MINLIVATSENGVIGKDGKMPWNIPADLKYFKEVTTRGESNIVIMGRKTYDSIGKALPGRTNYVITKNRNKEETDYIDGQVFNSIEDALDAAQGLEYFIKKNINVHIIGGGKIYNQIMEMGKVDVIYQTMIHANIDGDTYFHTPNNWFVFSEKSFLADENNSHDYTFRILTKGRDLLSSQDLNSPFQ